MTAAATNTRMPAIDIVVESGPWDGKDEDAARSALEQTAVVVGRNFKGHALSVLLHRRRRDPPPQRAVA